MHESQPRGGSATRWGPLFGARAGDWAETWEGPAGWGTPAYEHVLDRAKIVTVAGSWIVAAALVASYEWPRTAAHGSQASTRRRR